MKYTLNHVVDEDGDEIEKGAVALCSLTQDQMLEQMDDGGMPEGVALMIIPEADWRGMGSPQKVTVQMSAGGAKKTLR